VRQSMFLSQNGSEMVNVFVIVMIASLSVAYVTQFLLLERKDHHEGPFKNRNVVVMFPGTDDGEVIVYEHKQYAAMQDYFRRFFGAYRVDENGVWIVTDKAEVFTCPFCLSFWTTFLASIPVIILLHVYIQNPIMAALFFPFLHLSTCSLSNIFRRLM
jgi:hypothetical protein